LKSSSSYPVASLPSSSTLLPVTSLQ
jgi:hypothetical protein